MFALLMYNFCQILLGIFFGVIVALQYWRELKVNVIKWLKFCHHYLLALSHQEFTFLVNADNTGYICRKNFRKKKANKSTLKYTKWILFKTHSKKLQRYVMKEKHLGCLALELLCIVYLLFWVLLFFLLLQFCLCML